MEIQLSSLINRSAIHRNIHTETSVKISPKIIFVWFISYSGLILGLRPANERRRCNVTPSSSLSPLLIIVCTRSRSRCSPVLLLWRFWSTRMSVPRVTIVCWPSLLAPVCFLWGSRPSCRLPWVPGNRMDFLPDTQNCGLHIRRKCRESFPRHRGSAIPTCITARASRTCRNACRDR